MGDAELTNDAEVGSEDDIQERVSKAAEWCLAALQLRGNQCRCAGIVDDEWRRSAVGIAAALELSTNFC